MKGFRRSRFLTVAVSIAWMLALLLAACSVEFNTDNPRPTLASTNATAAPRPETSAPVPPWAALELSGRLLFMVSTPPDNRTALAQFDLLTGDQATVFESPPRAWFSSFSMSPDNNLLVISYQSPADEGQTAAGYSGLYWLPADGSAPPAPLLVDDGAREAFFSPTWSPDGRYIYYSLYQRLEADNGAPFAYNVERMSYPEGRRELLAENALWPSLSPDGRRLAYLSFAPDTLDNELFLADADGRNAVAALESGTFPAVDGHFFSADSSLVYFSAVNQPAPSGSSWLDRILGVEAAEAHDVPSDWWRVSATGGPPERLTTLGAVGLHGDLAPDGRHIAFLSSSGLWVMDPHGHSVTGLLETAAFGALQWIP